MTDADPASGASGTEHTSPRAGLLAVLAVAVLAVSCAAIFVRLADAPGTVVALYRMAIASLLLAPLTIRALRRSGLRGRALALTVAAGALLALHFASWITSLGLTSVAASVTLVATSPLWAALFTWLFGRRAPHPGVLAGALVAVIGAALVATGDGGLQGRAAGNALALVGAVAVAGYLNLGRAVQRTGVALDAYVGSAYTFAAIFLLPLPALLGQPYFGHSASTYAWMALLALVPQLIGHTGLNYVSRRLDTAVVATATLAEPVGAGILALLIFRELPGTTTLAGAAVVLVGLAVTLRFGMATAPAGGTATDESVGERSRE